MPPVEPGAAVLGCDLDGTFVRVNTFPRFTVFAMLRLARGGRFLSAGRIAAAIALRRLRISTHTQLKASVHSAASVLEVDLLQSWVGQLLAKHTNPAVRNLVDGWTGTTVLATAAPSLYAELIAERAGFDLCLASQPGEKSYVDNMSEVKAARLATLVGSRIACAITDEEDVDLALLHMAETAFLVDPDGSVQAWPAVPPDADGSG